MIMRLGVKLLLLQLLLLLQVLLGVRGNGDQRPDHLSQLVPELTAIGGQDSRSEGAVMVRDWIIISGRQV
jgi:hypothetical protein